MLKNSRYIIAVTIFLLNGCVGIDDVMRNTSALQSSTDFLQRRLTSPDLAQFFIKNHQTLPHSQWQVDDLTLTALYYQSNLKIAQAQLELAQAAVITAGQSPNPVIGITPTRDTGTSPVQNLLGLNLSLPIETNGKKDLRIAQSKAGLAAAKHRYNSLVWDTHRQVADTLLALQTSQQALTTYNLILATDQKLLDVYKKQKVAGQMVSMPAYQANIAYQQNILAKQQAEKAVLVAKNNLATTLSVPLVALQNISFSHYTANQFTTWHLTNTQRKQAVQQNYLIRAALADYDAAHKALEIEVAKQVPDIDLGPSYEWNSQQGGKYALGLSFTLPIMNNNEGPMAEAKAKLNLAAATFNQVQDKVLLDIDQAQANLTAAQTNFKYSLNLTKITAQRQRELQTSLKNSKIAQLPIAATSLERATLQLIQIDAQNQLLQAGIALEDSLRQPILGSHKFLNTLLK